MSGTPSSTGSSSGQARGAKILAPFRVRDFALYWTARTVSFVGDGFMFVALPWQVYALSNSPSAMGLVGALQTVAILAFVLFGGVASDRFERKRVIVVADVARALAAGAIGVLAISGDLVLWHVCVMAVVFGLGRPLRARRSARSSRSSCPTSCSCKRTRRSSRSTRSRFASPGLRSAV